MSMSTQKQYVYLVVQFEVEGIKNAEQLAADWMNSVLTNAPPMIGIQPQLPILTIAEYEQHAHQAVRKVVDVLEAYGETVPDSFREVLLRTAHRLR